MKIEEILGTTKDDNETWQDVFDRKDKEGGLDHKTIIQVLIYILEELDEKQDENIFREIPEIATEDTGPEVVIEPTETASGTAESSDELQGGVGLPKEEVQPGPTDSK